MIRRAILLQIFKLSECNLLGILCDLTRSSCSYYSQLYLRPRLLAHQGCCLFSHLGF
ncbi:hypothetical protein Hanom_Chr06g00502581 [Helianthus anomalus]